MYKQRLSLVALTLIVALAAACAPAATPAPTPIPAVNLPLPVEPGPITENLAPVDSVEVVLLESLPVQAQVIVRGNLPDGCTQLGDVEALYAGGVFTLKLKTKRQADAVCPQVITPYEFAYRLNVDGLPAAPYTVRVNGVSAVFQLPGADDEAASFAEMLAQAIEARDYATLERAMDSEFALVLWMSEGQALTPAQAVEQLRLNYLLDSVRVERNTNFDELLGGRPLAAFAPHFKVERGLLLKGVGQDGLGEAILFVARNADGGYYWNGMLVAPQGLSPEGLATHTEWRTYTNAKHGFSIQIPAAWEVTETPGGPEAGSEDQVWFTSTPLRPNTDQRPDVGLVIVDSDPLPNWQPERFNDFKTERVWVGGVESVKITGVHKVTGAPEAVLIAPLGDKFLQAYSNGDPNTAWMFDLILSTLRQSRAGAESVLPIG